MELKESKTKLENSSLMDAINGHVLSFTQISEKESLIIGNISLEDESGQVDDKEDTFVIYKEQEHFILTTGLFTTEQQKFTFVVKKYSIEIKSLSNSELEFTFIINTN